MLLLDIFSSNPADADFTQGMTDVLLSDLAQIRGWRIISRTSTEAYRNTGESIAQIGNELNGNVAVAFDMLDAIRAANNLPPNLAFDPLFEPLRNDERYAKLLR